MKAVIMAGGEGKRLRPLTETIPKPLARLCGRPVINYVLELLQRSGVTDCVLTLGYQASALTAHLAETDWGMRVRWTIEEQPLGTAGGVRAALAEWGGVLEEAVLVASADALCDLPLEQAAALHAQSGAAVTIVATKVDDPREYGLILADENGRVTGFVEKPSFAQVTSEFANTGIYMVSPEAMKKIPLDKPFDFAQDLFPLLLQGDKRIQACALQGYWCDIGDLCAYRRAQVDLLAGKVALSLAGQRDEAGNLLAGKRPAGKYELKSPVYLGAGVQIGDGAVIGAGSVLDEGCTVASGAQTENVVLLPHSALGEHARVRQAILCAGATVKSNASIRPGAAIGEGAVIGRGSVVNEQVRVESGAFLPDGATAMTHLTASKNTVSQFDDEGLCGEIGVDLTPELAARIGCAIGSIAEGKPVGVAAGDARAGQVLSSALIAGIRSTGAAVMDFGSVFEAMFGFAMGYNALTVGVYVDVDTPGTGAFKVVCDAGLPASRRLERKIEQLLAHGEFTRAPRGGFGDRVDVSGIGVIYQSELRRMAPEGLGGMKAKICSENPLIERMLGDLLTRLGCEKSQEEGLTLTVSGDGRRLSIKEGETKLSSQRVVAAYALLLFEQQQDLAVENDFPHALDLFAQERGRRVYRYLLCPADRSDEQGRRLAAQQCARDGLMLSVVLLGYLRRRGISLSQLARELPDFAVEQAEIAINLPPAQMLSHFTGERTNEGMLLRDQRGLVLLRPRKSGNAIRVFAEAANWETARSLCDELRAQIADLLDK